MNTAHLTKPSAWNGLGKTMNFRHADAFAPPEAGIAEGEAKDGCKEFRALVRWPHLQKAKPGSSHPRHVQVISVPTCFQVTPCSFDDILSLIDTKSLEGDMQVKTH